MIIRDLQSEHLIFGEEDSTPPLYSVPGSIAASLGLGVEDLPHLFGGRDQTHGYMITKWRMPVNLLNPLQPVVNVMTTKARDLRFTLLPDDTDTEFPGCLIAARTVLFASARSFDDGLYLLRQLQTMRPDDWSNSEGRTEVMEVTSAMLPLEVSPKDHTTIEGALCRMMGVQPFDLVRTGICYRRRATDLINGRSEWREDEIDDLLIPAFYDFACKLQEAIPQELPYDDAGRAALAALRPAQAATAWQLWPTLRNEVEACSEWFSVHRLGSKALDENVG